jgi:transcriptional regulator with XRE-family HTH domain
MGRREAPVRASSKAMSELALWLRSERSRSGLTYAQLASRTGISAPTLSRATKGGRLPTQTVVEAFARGCGADVRKATALWRRARYANERSGREEPALVLPEYVHNFVQLHAAVRGLYQRVGSPPLRRLEATTPGQHGRLPHSSVSRMLRGQAIPRRELLLAFVQACATIAHVEIGVWEAAWDRANEDRQYDRASSRNRAQMNGVAGLAQALRVAEQRVKKLQERRAVHASERAVVLRSYQEVAELAASPTFRIEEEGAAERKRQLLEQLLAADAAITTLQRKIEKTGEYIAVLEKRLMAEEP